MAAGLQLHGGLPFRQWNVPETREAAQQGEAAAAADLPPRGWLRMNVLPGRTGPPCRPLPMPTQPGCPPCLRVPGPRATAQPLPGPGSSLRTSRKGPLPLGAAGASLPPQCPHPRCLWKTRLLGAGAARAQLDTSVERSDCRTPHPLPIHRPQLLVTLSCLLRPITERRPSGLIKSCCSEGPAVGPQCGWSRLRQLLAWRAVPWPCWAPASAQEQGPWGWCSAAGGSPFLPRPQPTVTLFLSLGCIRRLPGGPAAAPGAWGAQENRDALPRRLARHVAPSDGRCYLVSAVKQPRAGPQGRACFLRGFWGSRLPPLHYNLSTGPSQTTGWFQTRFPLGPLKGPVAGAGVHGLSDPASCPQSRRS